jgi:hypothetical protein
MTTQALVTRNDAVRTFSFTPAAVEMRDTALAGSALVCRVKDADEQKVCVAAQTALAECRRLVEKSRKAAKEPVVEFGREIDRQSTKFIQEVEREEIRLAKLAADFQQLEQARIRAAQQAENERLLQIEREKAVETINAKSHDELDAIAEKYDQRVKDESVPMAEPPRAKGQVVKTVWDYEVTNYHELYRWHPNYVDLRDRRADILAGLNAGQPIKGVRAFQVTKSGVRTNGGKAIEV